MGYKFFFFILILSSCAFSENSKFIRFWNDGFIYDEKRMNEIQQKRDDYYKSESLERKN